MSYQLEPQERLDQGLKRIVLTQIDAAAAQLTGQPDGPDEAIHEARKRFKKIRAVLRLVRDVLGADVYKAENAFYRDAGRTLAAVRDSAVYVETLDRLALSLEDRLEPHIIDVTRSKLVYAHESVRADLVQHKDQLAVTADTLREARARVFEWPLEIETFEALAPSLHRVYKRGYKRMAKAYADPTPERFHEWRKRAKYLRYQARILSPIWPPVMSLLVDELHTLTDILGDEHDLTVFQDRIAAMPEASANGAQAIWCDVIDGLRTELRAKARPLGQRLYAERPKAFTQRLVAYGAAQPCYLTSVDEEEVVYD